MVGFGSCNPIPAEVRRLWLFLQREGKFTHDQRHKIQKLFIYSTKFIIEDRHINSLKSNRSQSRERVSHKWSERIFILISGVEGTLKTHTIEKTKKNKKRDKNLGFLFGGMHVGCPMVASHKTMYMADSESSFITPFLLL